MLLVLERPILLSPENVNTVAISILTRKLCCRQNRRPWQG